MNTTPAQRQALLMLHKERHHCDSCDRTYRSVAADLAPALLGEVEELEKERDSYRDKYNAMVRERDQAELKAVAVAEAVGKERDGLAAKVEEMEKERDSLRGAIKTLKEIPPSGEALAPCGHNSYWIGCYGRCMCCAREQAERERDQLKALLLEVLDGMPFQKAYVVDHANDTISRAPTLRERIAAAVGREG